MPKPRKPFQIAIRLEDEDIRAIVEMADEEKRSNSEVVRFLIRWGAEHYKFLRSFRAMDAIVEKRKQFQETSHFRLQLLTEAKEENDEEFSEVQRPKKIRAR